MKSRAYRQYISTIPCLICGNPEVQVHHLLRTGEHGIGKKSGDEWCVPLCVRHHDQLHRNGDEVIFFGLHGFDYVKVKRWCLNGSQAWIKIHGEPKSGGKRKGAARKNGQGKFKGLPTKPMRVPVKFWFEVERFIKEKMSEVND